MAAYRYTTIYHTTNLTTYRLIDAGQDQVIIGVAGQRVDLLADRLREVIQSTPGDSFIVTQIEDLCQRFIGHFQQTYQKKYRLSFDGDVLEGIGILWLTNQATGRGYQWGKCQLIAVGNPSSRSLVQASGQIQEFNILPDTRLVIDLHNTDIASFVAALPEQAFASGDSQELLTGYPYAFSATLVQAPTNHIFASVSAVLPVSETQLDPPIDGQNGSKADPSTKDFPPRQPLVINRRQLAYVCGVVGLMLVGWLGWQQQRDQAPAHNSMNSLSLVQPLTSHIVESEPKTVVVAPKNTSLTTAHSIATLRDTVAVLQTHEQKAKSILLQADGALKLATDCIQSGQNAKARSALDIADKNYRTYLQLKPDQVAVLRLRMNKLNQLRVVAATEESSF
ncbi:MAG: hypothetical protein H7Z72_21840 [Bacteroidetes bacterium]|nr:hypothetical protein [Fibrella sp.]